MQIYVKIQTLFGYKNDRVKRVTRTKTPYTLFSMTLKNKKNSILLVGLFILFLFLYVWFIKTPYFYQLEMWSQQNSLLYFIFLTIIKILSIVWPPLPGGVFTYASIPLLGWWQSYLADFLGSMIGSSIAFYLGKKYGYSLLNKLFDKKTIEKIKSIKVRKDKEIEGTFVFRFTVGPAFLEAICYGAGIIGIQYRNFIAGSILSHTLSGIPSFYFVRSVTGGSNLIVILVSSLLFLIIMWKFRKRYFEDESSNCIR